MDDIAQLPEGGVNTIICGPRHFTGITHNAKEKAAPSGEGVKNAPGLLIDVSLSKNINNRKGASRGQYALLGTFTVVLRPGTRFL
nr:MAG TPA: hypothetical protein [Bacteriophage sp.]